ncbi:MAG: cell division protein FtsA [Beijerinckiaceae bacterium]
MSGFHHGLTPKMRPLSARKSAVMAVLDIGFTKVACVIARLEPADAADAGEGRTHRCRVLGIGHQRSRGLKGGVIVDMEAAERTIRSAIDAAERMAGLTIESVVVSLTGGRLASQHFTAEVGIGGRAITDRNVERAMAAATMHSIGQGRVALHALPTAHRLDGRAPVRDPRGMIADRLSVDMHVATADATPARNLMLAVERCHVEVEALVAAPYVSGLAVLDADEAEMGAVVVDMGGGSTSFSVFLGGHLQAVDAIAVGGHHVTTDLARGLTMRLDDAERLKGIAGGCHDDPAREREMITVPQVGDDERQNSIFVPRAHLTRIIRPRVEEILELVRDRCRASGFGEVLNRSVVLTGGASQLSGLQTLAQGVLARHVRLGRPIAIKGMPESAKSPSFAATVGMLIYPQVAGLEHFGAGAGPAELATGTDGYISRVGRWFRDNF